MLEAFASVCHFLKLLFAKYKQMRNITAIAITKSAHLNKGVDSVFKKYWSLHILYECG